MSFHPNDPSVLAKISNCPSDIYSMPAGAPTASLKLASRFSQLTNPFIMTMTSKLAPCTTPSPACHPAAGTSHGALLHWLSHVLLMGAPMCLENQLQMVQNVVHLVFNQPKRVPVTTLLIELQRLPTSSSGHLFQPTEHRLDVLLHCERSCSSQR